ncbi:sensor histidine kinase [Microbacteriaceae bacterium VKM Ac-2854]|nr:sensor histidine kinase [Microbacteriaceae bacterium VKM Ac-2854]
MSSSTSAATDPFADGWVRRPPTRTNFRRDAIVAVVLFAATLASIAIYSAARADAPHPPTWVNVAWAVAMTLPLALRRRFPATVAVIAAVAFFVGQTLTVPEMTFNQIALFVAIYTLGAWGRRRGVAVVVRLLIIVGMFVWLAWAVITANWYAGSTVPSTDAGANLISPYAAYALLTVIINLLYFGGVYVFGESSRLSARRLEALESRTAELDDERERTARQAVALERIRIARELHDVVAHHVSVMGVQAGAARRVLARDPERATESLAAIEQNARTAVDELHRMLVALRADDLTVAPPASDAASTRGLDQLDELVAESVEAGLPVAVQVIGDAVPVPATIGLSLFRVAQESLTNARKHAGVGAEVDLRIRYLEGAIEVEISDHGGVRARAEAPAASGGLGQIGMRERMAAVGGVIEMRSNTRGGYLVRARVPLAPSPGPLPSDQARAAPEGVIAQHS